MRFGKKQKLQYITREYLDKMLQDYQDKQNFTPIKVYYNNQFYTVKELRKIL